MIIASLGRAALMGGIAGLGAECVVNRSGRDKGSLIMLGVIVGGALQALALCFGVGAAYGAVIGAIFG